jgi:hypothetical protein
MSDVCIQDVYILTLKDITLAQSFGLTCMLKIIKLDD